MWVRVCVCVYDYVYVRLCVRVEGCKNSENERRKVKSPDGVTYSTVYSTNISITIS